MRVGPRGPSLQGARLDPGVYVCTTPELDPGVHFFEGDDAIERSAIRTVGYDDRHRILNRAVSAELLLKPVD